MKKEFLNMVQPYLFICQNLLTSKQDFIKLLKATFDMSEERNKYFLNVCENCNFLSISYLKGVYTINF